MKKITKPNSIRFSVLITAVIASLLVLLLPRAPYVFIGLIWIEVILYLSFTSNKNFIKILGINVCAIILALVVFEMYQWFKTGELYIERNRSNYEYVIDSVLGYAPVKNSKMLENRYYKDKLIYEVTYTIDSNGLRISPPYNESKVEGTILFFGCSFTFGVGVKDNETMPYQVGIKTSGKYRIYNFGFGGYGPHQMLSELEHGLVKKIVKRSGTMYAIYQAIPHHVDRVAGLDFWDYHGPKYILSKNGTIHFAGHFDDGTIIPQKIIEYLNKSLIYRYIIGNRRFFNRNKDLKLYTAIVCKAKKIFEKQFPGGKFHVIFWNNRSKRDEKPSKILETSKIIELLINDGIMVHLTSDIITDYQKNRSKYNVGPHDGHPNPLANSLIAEYIVHNIINK